ncbi:prepilin-type N-terminal cleavage/methylation domain-containing protein [Helicobacter burdigaliensis]|uniref:prepilin-type N-terminal cleavage/methylation domain-containing protein n=1 Tax=Helicobacter burdigaliensis TaxID=2315334 RepID=UPI000EF735B0|nr:prepilin-type N-terminal cleavage/methylation domain-containing protein [Helicobacter burdigaliensis]
MRFKKRAFSLFEVLITLILLGILSTLALPKFYAFREGACTKKLQLQIFEVKLKIAGKREQNNGEIEKVDFSDVFENLDFKQSSCYFKKQKNAILGVNGDKKVSFVIKNGILECQNTKSSRLHNGESYCDIF